METPHSSEKSVSFCFTPRHHIPEYSTVHSHPDSCTPCVITTHAKYADGYCFSVFCFVLKSDAWLIRWNVTHLSWNRQRKKYINFIFKNIHLAAPRYISLLENKCKSSEAWVRKPEYSCAFNTWKLRGEYSFGKCSPVWRPNCKE
jgi:hypothetical protein